jgi:hypothetical protein
MFVAVTIGPTQAVTTQAPQAMYGCALGSTITVQRDVAYDIRCQHDGNTQNVTWTFTSAVDQSTQELVQCMVYSRNPDMYCKSLLPYFNIVRPDFMYTSLQVVWDLLPPNMRQGQLECSLDGQTSKICDIYLDARSLCKKHVYFLIRHSLYFFKFK